MNNNALRACLHWGLGLRPRDGPCGCRCRSRPQVLGPCRPVPVLVMPSLFDGGGERSISWEAGQDCLALGLPQRRGPIEKKRLGPLDQAPIRSLATLQNGPVNQGQLIFWKTMTGSRVGLGGVRPEHQRFPGLTQTCWASCIMMSATRCC